MKTKIRAIGNSRGLIIPSELLEGTGLQEGDEVEVFNQANFPKDRIRTIIGEYHVIPVKDRLQNLGYRYFEYPNQHFMARI